MASAAFAILLRVFVRMSVITSSGVVSSISRRPANILFKFSKNEARSVFGLCRPVNIWQIGLPASIPAKR